MPHARFTIFCTPKTSCSPAAAKKKNGGVKNAAGQNVKERGQVGTYRKTTARPDLGAAVFAVPRVRVRFAHQPRAARYVLP